ncbi:MAG: DNA internalization-related competence protein ComEC/Rec2 [Lysobacteraceae bacterium]
MSVPRPPLRLDFRLGAAWLSGTLLAFALPVLPPIWLCWSLLGLAVLGCFAWPRARLPSILLLGLAWTCLHASWGMQARLPAALEGVDLEIAGRVLGLPEQSPGQLRFDLRVEQAEGEAAALIGQRLRLSWYRSAHRPEPGSRWSLQVRLKRPRGSVNPGGFDYERHALERGIVATGYVRDAAGNVQREAGGGIDALRARVSAHIGVAVDAPRARFAQALAVGDVRGLDETDWEVLRATGIAHLIAISGMHVGMVAGFGALLIALLYRLFPAIGLRFPLPQGAALAALLFAAGYTALAGFALPTVRTLLMIAAVLAAVLLRRAVAPTQALVIALVAVLAADPLAVLNAGFWLSFLGVAWLIWCLPREVVKRPWRGLLGAQWAMSLGLLPLTVWFFGQASVAGPVANLLAVPWVSFVVVPLALIGALPALFGWHWGDPLLRLSAWLMDGLWCLLEPVAGLHGALVYLPEPDWLAMALALVGAFWLLMPRGVPGKPLAVLLWLPLLWPPAQQPAPGELDLHLLDVGQGLSLLLRTHDHALLYDAGPAWPGGLDMGEAAVLPSLRALGVARLDALLISHADNDHAGGAAAVKRGYQPPRVLASRKALEEGETACETGQSWQWDGVRFEMLHPPEHFPYLGNVSSCVLRIETADGRVVLLPGDIDTLIEARLLREQPGRMAADLLLVPHHGSRSSSSPDFVEAVSPAFALIASGHRNRFGLPREEVLERYRAAGATIEDTASAGAIHLRIDAAGVRVLARERERRQRLWRE